MADSVYGHPIPYALTDSEIQSFLTAHPDLYTHISSPSPGEWVSIDLPAYGMIVNEAYGQFLVWIDASFHLHVIDVTNLSIAAEVQKAPYVSPDDAGFWDNLFSQLKITAGAATTGVFNLAGMLAIFGIAILVIYAFPRAR